MLAIARHVPEFLEQHGTWTSATKKSVQQLRTGEIHLDHNTVFLLSTPQCVYGELRLTNTMAYF